MLKPRITNNPAPTAKITLTPDNAASFFLSYLRLTSDCSVTHSALQHKQLWVFPAHMLLLVTLILSKQIWRGKWNLAKPPGNHRSHMQQDETTRPLHIPTMHTHEVPGFSTPLLFG